MEITSDLEQDKVLADGGTDEVSPSPDPPQETESSFNSKIENAEEFERRVRNLMTMMEDDPKIRDRMLAEIYVNIGSAEMGIRGIFEAVQSQGIAGMMRGAFKRGS